ncbi:MAG: DUF11 domain-containing protein [Verrucomicrobia bacterium]|nr:DUF11 domain-containing protein [Verrucomicrobiota bacterium]
MPAAALILVSLAAWTARGQLEYQQLRAFGNTNVMAATPDAPLVEAGDGRLYGTTRNGGAAGCGTVFGLDRDGTGLTILHSFGVADDDGKFPGAALLEGSDGRLYGVTTEGGSAGMGVLFAMAPSGADYVILRHFAGGTADGQMPSSALIEGSDGVLYGVCPRGGSAGYGTIFKINKNGTGYTVMRHFTGGKNDGENPMAPLLEGSDGVLYGTTQFGGNTYQEPFTGNNVGVGVVFKIARNGTGYGLVKKFASNDDARHPKAPLIEATNGMLYGSAPDGGATYTDEYGEPYMVGVVFRMDKTGQNYEIVRQFLGVNDAQTPAGGVTQSRDGMLYGTGEYDHPNYAGALYRMNPDGSGYAVLFHWNVTNGLAPRTPLLEGSDGILYGTTGKGGFAEAGTVFCFDRTQSVHAVLHHFNPSGGDPGELGTPLLEGSDGWLYGVSRKGGDFNVGSLFKIAKTGAGLSILHSFVADGVDGSEPAGPLVEGSDHMLYGATTYGGTNGTGILFKLNRDGSGYAILHHFASGGGPSRNPTAGVIEGSDGRLYGTSSLGGASGRGTVFRVNKDGSAFTNLFSFGPGDIWTGRNPNAPLCEASDGYLYGTTPAPAYTNDTFSSFGTVYRLRPDGTGYGVVHSFQGYAGDGRNPAGGIVQDTNGWFYAATQSGGTGSAGTVYRFNMILLDPPYEVIHHFTTNDQGGHTPVGGPQVGPDARVYGTTSAGGSAHGGILYRLDAVGGNFETLHHFGITLDDGRAPRAALLHASDHRLYGTTAQGGLGNLGTVFCCGAPQSESADLGVAVVAQPDPVALGGTVTCAVTVSNAGPSTAAGVVGIHPLSAGVAFVSATPSQGSCALNGGVIECALGSLAPAASATVAILLSPLQAGWLTNVVTVTSDTTDDHPANNAATAILTVLAPPTISPIPDSFMDEDTALSVPFTIGDVETPAAELAVSAESDNPALAPPAGVVLSGGGSNRTVTVTPASNQWGTARITITVRDLDGLSASAPFLLTVNPVPDLPIIIAHPQPITVAEGGTILLVVDAEGLPPLVYQWQRASVALSGHTNATLTISNAQAADAGAYSAVVSGPEGSVTSQTAQVRVLVRPLLEDPNCAAGQAGFAFVARKGCIYTVECADTPTAPVWTAFPALEGQGDLVRFTDTNAPPTRRFYRVRVD